MDLGQQISNWEEKLATLYRESSQAAERGLRSAVNDADDKIAVVEEHLERLRKLRGF